MKNLLFLVAVLGIAIVNFNTVFADDFTRTCHFTPAVPEHWEVTSTRWLPCGGYVTVERFVPYQPPQRVCHVTRPPVPVYHTPVYPVVPCRSVVIVVGNLNYIVVVQ